MTGRHLSFACLGACLLASLLAHPASAQDACFTVGGQRGAAAQQLVSLHQTVQVDARCELAIAAQGPYFGPGDLAGRDVDFVELWAHLEAQPNAHASGDPRVIYARPTGRGAADVQHTLMLRYCAHYLLEEQLGFRVVPEAADGGIRVERVSGPSCDAGRLELRAVTGASRARIWTREAAQTLGASQRDLELPQGDWSVYAARPGSSAGLRIGVFRSQRVVTPLQNHLHVVGLAGASSQPPLLAARWSPSTPGLLLYPTPAALERELLWPELRTASDAGVLWVAGRNGDQTPVVLGNVQLEAGEPAGVRLPDSVVRAYMRSTYGDAGGAMAPNNQDWREIFAGLAICLAPSYHDARPAPVGQPAPSADACASLSGLAVLAQAEAAAPQQAQLCLRHGMQRMTSEGPRQELGEPDCFPLPAPGSLDDAPERIAVAGDRVQLSGNDLCAVVDGRPVPFEEGTNELVLPPGLLEVRQGGGEGCASRQAVARLRLPVIDPASEWHPVGLYTGGEADAMRCAGEPEEGGRVCPWQAIARDERDTFAYVDPRHELSFRLSTSAPVAAAVNGRAGGEVQLTQDIPVLSGTRGDFGGARSSALVAYVSRSDRCPSDRPVRELREEVPVDVDDLLVDSTFHVYLLGVSGLDGNATCLADARFRVHPSRALLTYSVEDLIGFEVGLLGDTQLAYFYASNPIEHALGLVLPVAWARFTPGIRFVAIEVAANLVGAVAFAPEELSLLGASLSAAVVIGIPEILPRILTVGGMIHLQADTYGVVRRPNYDVAAFSFFAGVNLSTLVDLAGGR